MMWHERLGVRVQGCVLSSSRYVWKRDRSVALSKTTYSVEIIFIFGLFSTFLFLLNTIYPKTVHARTHVVAQTRMRAIKLHYLTNR